ncbi:MAG: hypothetical protein WDO24_20145 [Pseudomonadota bacterium]
MPFSSAAVRGSLAAQPRARIVAPVPAVAARPVAQRAHLGSLRAGEHHAQRVEQHEFRVPLHGLRHVLPRGRGDELRQAFDLLTHDSELRVAQ